MRCPPKASLAAIHKVHLRKTGNANPLIRATLSLALAIRTLGQILAVILELPGVSLAGQIRDTVYFPIWLSYQTAYLAICIAIARACILLSAVIQQRIGREFSAITYLMTIAICALIFALTFSASSGAMVDILRSDLSTDKMRIQARRFPHSGHPFWDGSAPLKPQMIDIPRTDIGMASRKHINAIPNPRLSGVDNGQLSIAAIIPR